MAQINLSFWELIEITGTLSAYAEEIRDISTVEADRVCDLANELHARFARARTEADNAEDRLLTQEVLSHD